MYSIKHSSLSFVVDSILQYLLEHGRTEIVKSLITDKQIDINHQDCQGNTLLSTVLKNYQEAYINCDRDAITTSISSLTMLIELGCDLNSSIDSDGNTPIMLFLMLKDYATTYYYLVKRYSDKIDLSVKNKNGINATYLTLFINTNSIQGRLLRDELVRHKTYDFSFIDRYNNNLIMHMIIREDTSSAINFLLKNKTCINHVNDRKENILILAIKFRCYGMLSNYLFNEININQQDNKGNTALHYAVQMKDKFSINTLCFYNANLHIKNNEGITPYDLAVALKDDSIINILTKPVTPNLMKKEINISRFLLYKKMQSTNSNINNSSIKDIQNSNIYHQEYEHLLNNEENKYSLALLQDDKSKRFAFEIFLCDYYKKN